MTTWDTLRGDLRVTFALAYDEPTWCGLRWRIAGEDVDQRVEVVQVYLEPWVQIVTDLGAECDVSLREVLAINMTLPMGAIALDQARYVIRHQVALDDLRFGRFGRFATAMERLAGSAARLRATLRRPPVLDVAVYCAD